MSPVAPAWLVQDEVGLCPCGCIGKRTRAGFVQKTLTGGATLMRQAMFGEDIAATPGLLQHLDARVKLVTFLGLLVAAAVVRHVAVLAVLYAFALVVAKASNLSLTFFVRRVWLFVPLFTGVVVLPATLNLVTPGPIVVPMGAWWFGHRVGMTSTGLMAALLIVTRVAVSISLVVLLTLTTPWTRLMAGLRALLVPRMFIQVMGMAYRYLFHLLTAVDDMYTARKARTAGSEPDLASGRAFVAATAGSLFGKAHALSEEVHLAMVSRGYTGHARAAQEARPGATELCWTVSAVVVAAAALGADRVLLR